MAKGTTHNVFASKSGVLHVARTAAPWHSPNCVYTFGTWKGDTVKGPLRTLSPKNLTPAGTLTRTEDGWEYDASAAHV